MDTNLNNTYIAKLYQELSEWIVIWCLLFLSPSVAASPQPLWLLLRMQRGARQGLLLRSQGC